MSKLLNKFLEDEDRSRELLGTVGIWAGIILSILAVLNDFFAP
jgi:hypothetical protein